MSIALPPRRWATRTAREVPWVAMRLRDTLLAGYLLLATLSLTGVLFRGATTADGLYFGLPAGLAWITGWAIATPLVLSVYTLTRPTAGAETERT